MNVYQKQLIKNTYSEVIQTFTDPDIEVLFCRYWWFKYWEFSESSRPYWRIHFNPKPGAFILFDGKEYPLDPEKVFLIPPDTLFATRSQNSSYLNDGFLGEGGKISDSNENYYLESEEHVVYLYIHFNISIIHNYVQPGIYSFDMNEHLMEKIRIIIHKSKSEVIDFGLPETMTLYSLIGELFSKLPKDSWLTLSKDSRIIETIKFINHSLGDDLSNKTLAARINLAPQSFYRLFKEEMGIPPQTYIRKKRIDGACGYLIGTNESIESIANRFGLCNRFYFSRVFKESMNISPSLYRKNFTMH